MANKPIDWEVIKRLKAAGLSDDQIKALDRGVNHSGFAAGGGKGGEPSTTAKQSSTSARPATKTDPPGHQAGFAGSALTDAAKRAGKRNPNYKSTADKTSFAGTYTARKIGDALSGHNPKNARVSSIFKGKSSSADKAKRKARQEAAARALEKNGSAFYKEAEAARKKKKKVS